MRTAIRIIGGGLAAIILAMASGCTTTQVILSEPLTYVAVERPTGPIRAEGKRVETKHSRSGLYFFNWGFRPAPDVAAYLNQAQIAAGSDVLKNTEIEFNVPMILFPFYAPGFQFGSDKVRANQ